MKKKLINAICKFCGNEFERYASQYKDKPQFCSIECRSGYFTVGAPQPKSLQKQAEVFNKYLKGKWQNEEPA